MEKEPGENPNMNEGNNDDANGVEEIVDDNVQDDGALGVGKDGGVVDGGNDVVDGDEEINEDDSKEESDRDDDEDYDFKNDANDESDDDDNDYDDDDDEDFEIFEDDDDDDDDELVKKPKKSRGRRRGTTAHSRRRQAASSSDDEEFQLEGEDSESSEDEGARRTKQKPKRRKGTRRSSSDDDSEYSDGNNAYRSRGNHRKRKERTPPRVRRSKRTNVGRSNIALQSSSEEEGRGDDGGANGAQEDASLSTGVGDDKMSFCDEDSSQDSAAQNDLKPPPTVVSPQKPPLNVRTRYNTDDHSSSSDSERPLTANVHTGLRNREPPRCYSTHDIITHTALPAIHVCTLTPDGTRHCFALDTLYKAAIFSGLRNNTNRCTATNRLAFLQPPHFRTVMEDGLLDQIASRFGRRALIIEDTILYKRHHAISKRRAELFQSPAQYDDASLTSFAQMLNDFINSQMGVGDIYCCPICYTEAKRRFSGRAADDDESDDDDSYNDGDNDDANEIDGDNDNTNKIDNSAAKMDPMAILGDLDQDEFIIASTFCFRKMVQVKAHIRNDHNLTTTGIDGNELYQQFMIRAQDGLLQRYLRDVWKQRLHSGCMQRYWFEGNNRNFVLLRTLVDKVESMRGSGVMFDTDAMQFCRSVPNRAAKVWSRITAPYSKIHQKTFDKEFLDDGSQDEEGGGDGGLTLNPYFDRSDDYDVDKFVKDLRMRRERITTPNKGGGHKSSDDETMSNEEGSEDESSSASSSNAKIYQEKQEEESDEEDEWMDTKRNALAKMKEKRSNRIKKLQPGRIRLLSQSQEDDDEDDKIVVFHNEDASPVPSNLRIMESDDDTNSSEND